MNPSDPVGSAILTVTAGRSNVQSSNFGRNSFQVTNTGDKNIARIEIDVTDALFPDSVFDPFGEAGDTVAKPLSLNSRGNTGVADPNNSSYIGAGGIDGYEGIRLRFRNRINGGFEPGETLGFSVDMDPNSIAGASKRVLDSGTSPAWDVGGISGAEIIGSTFRVIFTDGTSATGQLQGDGSQAGSQALASEFNPERDVDLRVNGLAAGSVGTYSRGGPRVVVNGPAGQTARVVLAKGFIQPTTNAFFGSSNAADRAYAPQLQARLDALAAADFPANNAVELQTADVVLTGRAQNISNRFDFSGVDQFNFVGEDQLPLGFVASVIDPTKDDLPIGAVTEATYLQFSDDDGSSEAVHYRVNAGGPEIAALDDGPNWSADTSSNPSAFLVGGGNRTNGFAVNAGASVDASIPNQIFRSERWDPASGSEMRWAFDTPDAGLYEVNLLMGNGYRRTRNAGERVFDVEIEGRVLNNLNDIDLSSQFGHRVGGVISNTVRVTDGTLDITFLHGVQNPLINGIEVVQVS